MQTGQTYEGRDDPGRVHPATGSSCARYESLSTSQTLILGVVPGHGREWTGPAPISVHYEGREVLGERARTRGFRSLVANSGLLLWSRHLRRRKQDCELAIPHECKLRQTCKGKRSTQSLERLPHRHIDEREREKAAVFDIELQVSRRLGLPASISPSPTRNSELSNAHSHHHILL
ncbi:uncharacterized protein CLUP02_03432 [Colletotrichum lupini]|uniref:Uncharacterized protein n=1 Tax=Colletotrichum lupini TaxID=145971 RepID=A0A9Q8SIF7_9PEZI|nr:uncharacterized protein CLUP02_03432 [Colletotrichum lupini]UQC77959.1 hypothetical protein CLUP02_03432 [Colletotrichum lupini]